MTEPTNTEIVWQYENDLRRMIDSYRGDCEHLIEQQDFARRDLMIALADLTDVATCLMRGDASSAYHTLYRVGQKIRSAIDFIPPVDEIPF